MGDTSLAGERNHTVSKRLVRFLVSQFVAEDGVLLCPLLCQAILPVLVRGPEEGIRVVQASRVSCSIFARKLLCRSRSKQDSVPLRFTIHVQTNCQSPDTFRPAVA